MKQHSSTINVDYKGVELSLSYNYHPAYMSNDYLTPNEPEDVEVTEVLIGEIDAYSLLEDKLPEIEELTLEQLNN